MVEAQKHFCSFLAVVVFCFSLVGWDGGMVPCRLRINSVALLGKESLFWQPTVNALRIFFL